jgi:hypothetical protein
VRSSSLAIGLAVLGVIFLIIGVLYLFGVLQIAVSDPHASHHTTHFILFTVLAIASFIAANFARPKTA